MGVFRHTAWTLRAAAVGGLLAAVGIGCTLDLSGLASTDRTWSCGVTIRNAAGETQFVRSTDTDLTTTRSFITDTDPAAGCAITDQAGVEDDFQRWVQSAVPFRFRDMDGPWCIVDAPAGTICPQADSAFAPVGATCETPLPTAPSACESGERCIVLEPDTVDFESILTSIDGEGRSPVGFIEPRATPRVEVRNSCTESVRVYIDDQVQGENAMDFEIVGNACAPRPGTDDERLGRELQPAGSVDDACNFSIQFTPGGHRERVAEKRFSQDTTELYTLPIRGRGRGGNLQVMPAGPLCFDALVGPRGTCANATAQQTVTLENIGFGRLTVDQVRATGGFEVSDTSPFTLEVRPDPGAMRTLDVWWCGDTASGDDDASLIFSDNGVTTTTEVLLQRRAAGCP